jgi:hypothetical protein
MIHKLHEEQPLYLEMPDGRILCVWWKSEQGKAAYTIGTRKVFNLPVAVKKEEVKCSE